jgi:Ca2+-binding EF-hand superfamily protein
LAASLHRSGADLVFKAFERNFSNTISFNEYIAMLSVCRRGDTKEKLLCVFRIYG